MRISRTNVAIAAVAFSVSALAADPIKFGAVLPFSGGVELYGNQAKLGLDLAAKEINASGGVLGRPVEIVYEDDKTLLDPSTGRRVRTLMARVRDRFRESTRPRRPLAMQ